LKNPQAPADPAAVVSVSGTTRTVGESGISAGTVFEVFVTASDGVEPTRNGFAVTVRRKVTPRYNLTPPVSLDIGETREDPMDTGPDAAERLHAALLTFLESAERGAPVGRDSLLADYPEFSPELRDFLDGYELVDRVSAPVREVVRAVRLVHG
jgi:hypothetical protein